MGETQKTVRARDLFTDLRKEHPSIEQAENRLGSKLILARNVLRLRVQRGWTQAELAEHAGMRQPRIAEIESAKRDTQIETVDRLAVAFSVPSYTLLQPAEERRKNRGRIRSERVVAKAEARELGWFGPTTETETVLVLARNFGAPGERTDSASRTSYVVTGDE